MTTPLPQGVGFSGDTFFTTMSRENINFSLLDFNQGEWQWKRSFGVERNVVRGVIMNKAVALGIQPAYEVQINGHPAFRSGVQQVLYLEDGTEIMAMNLRVGQRLRGILTQNNNFSGAGLGLLSNAARYPLEITSHRALKQNTMLYHCSTFEHNSYMLSCGVVAKALPL